MVEDLRRENLEGKTIVELNQLCRDHSVKGVIGRPKGDMINYMVAFNESRPVEEVMAEQGQTPQTPPAQSAETSEPSGSGGWQNLDEVQSEPEQETSEAQSEPVQEEETQVEEEPTTVAQT